jgi:ABC-type transport system involved in cytochrome c biogenesis permease subunit
MKRIILSLLLALAAARYAAAENALEQGSAAPGAVPQSGSTNPQAPDPAHVSPRLQDFRPDAAAPAPGGAADPHAAMGVTSLLPTVGPGHAPPSSLSDVSALQEVAVLHEGRIKPMETFARHMLLQFSGRTTYQKSTALQVMARILFTPELVGDYSLFLINNPEVVQALGVAEEKRRRYSFHQLEKALPKLQEMAEKADAVEDEKRDLVQKEVLRVYGNMVQFVNLARTFSFALPNPIYTVTLAETKRQIELPPSQTVFSFWDLMSRAQSIAKVLEGIGDRKEDQRTAEEKEIIGLSQSMFMNSQSMHPSPFKVLPVPGTGSGWVSPSEVVAAPDALQSFHREMADWAAAAQAYRQGNRADFEKGMKDFTAAIENRAYEQLSATHFPLEILYQKTEPFYYALVLYWIALLACFLFFLFRRQWVYKTSLITFLAGYAVHIAGIVSRIIIMKRPPVTSLYETFPFVAAVAILAALFIERINAKRASAGIGLLCSSMLGVILLSIANRYAADGDTMRMLVAVLNSNFWLSTHVVCVTIGYSACLLAGAIGHIWLVRALIPGDESKAERLKEIAKMVYGTVCFGLLFSFIGTVLGGIWADQSWGRFWGWDPKENGALLIVIWCIILLHAKHWGYIRNQGLALGSVFGAITVSLAWFGVNLLNVGLHSYGFTSGAATKLFTYVGAELIFMGIAAAGLKLGWGSRKAVPKDGSTRRAGDPAAQAG